MSRAKSKCVVSEVMESIIFSFRLQGNSMDCDESKPEAGQGGEGFVNKLLLSYAEDLRGSPL